MFLRYLLLAVASLLLNCVAAQATMQHPYLSKTLPIDWDKMTPEAALIDIPLALKAAQAQIDAIAAIAPQKAMFANTFAALEDALEDLGTAWGYVGNLKAVDDTPALREAYAKLLPAVTAFFTDVYLNEALYKVLVAAAKNTSPGSLLPEQHRFVDEVLEDFREQGIALPLEQRQQLKVIYERLAAITEQYSDNVLDATNAWELIIENPAQLAGLPESVKASALQSAIAKGKATAEKPAWRFTLQAPSVQPLMTYLDSTDIRRQVWLASSAVATVAPHDNRPLIQEILKLRTQLAQLLGKDHFPDYVLSRRMAKDGATALRFIEDLHERIQDAFGREQRVLQTFRAEKLGLKQPEPLEPWDVGYWAEKLRQEHYDFDDELLRPYFPEDHVIAGLFNLASHVFGIEIEEQATPASPHRPGPVASTWNPEVQYFKITDLKTGQILGYFYSDWHPRETKRGGAWMSDIITAGPLPQKAWEPHVGSINGNFTPAVGKGPALLTHYEVVTAFHEFGHLLHHILSEVPVRKLSGVRVAWDFVEFPSQLMENWCWEPESLNRFARHYQDDEAMPETLLNKMLAAKNFMAASSRMRQLMLAKMDLELHLHPQRYINLDPEALNAAIQASLKDYLPALKTPSPSIAPRFSHIFGSPTGYASAYYSYQWAEALEADAFSKFLMADDGVLSPLIGAQFRRNVLSRGNSTPPDILFRDFMEREPDLNSLLIRDGIRPAF